jgi:hypothetical protein
MQPGGVCVGLRKELCWRGRKGDQVAGTAGMEASPSRGGHRRPQGGNAKSGFQAFGGYLAPRLGADRE